MVKKTPPQMSRQFYERFICYQLWSFVEGATATRNLFLAPLLSQSHAERRHLVNMFFISRPYIVSHRPLLKPGLDRLLMASIQVARSRKVAGMKG